MLGSNYVEINEAYTTQTCSTCGALAGPIGESDLNIRNWVCLSCGVSHDRDVNAALNILRAGHGPLTLEISLL
jgi:transposase